MTDYIQEVNDARYVLALGISLSSAHQERIVNAMEKLLAERDALKAQLDSMTTEWANWIESASAHVPGISIEHILTAFRSGSKPFGVAAGVEVTD